MEATPARPVDDRIRVLLADDHPIVRSGLASLLSQQQDVHVVGEAADGARAVELVRELHPHVVLMDLRMPVLDGVGAITEITREHHDVRILVLTTFDGDGDVRRALTAGAHGYLLKDMLLTQVVDAVRAVHRGERVLPSAIAERLAEHVGEEDLSAREIQVLSFAARGFANAEIAKAIGRSDETVKAHLKRIFVKLGVSDRTEAVTVALSRGMLIL
jgi:two-component system NarL family response regulator